MRSGTAEVVKVIWVGCEAEYFFEKGWTGKSLICLSRLSKYSGRLAAAACVVQGGFSLTRRSTREDGLENPPYSLPRNSYTLSGLRARHRLDCVGYRNEQSQGATWKRREAKITVEGRCLLVLCLDDDGEDSERTGGGENAPDGIGQQEIADALAANAQIARQAPDQRRRNQVVSKQTFGMLGREIDDGESKCAETVETNHTQSIVDRNENASNVALLILARSKMEPIIQRRRTAGERTPFVLAEGLDGSDHKRSAEDTAVALESLDKAWRRLGVTLNRGNECIPIRAQQNHPLVLFQ